jgi:prepilin peptidase CpaA
MPPPPSLSGTGQILLGILVLIAAVYDIRFRRIPNWLVLAGLVAGFAWNVYSAGWSGLSTAVEGLGTGFILYFPLYLLRARGAGDVKLLAAVGAITGPGNCLWIFLLTAVLGGVIALVLVLFHGRARRTFFNVGWIVQDLLHFRAPYRSSDELDVTTTKGMRLPHGLMIAVGASAFLVMVRFGLRI